MSESTENAPTLRISTSDGSQFLAEEDQAAAKFSECLSSPIVTVTASEGVSGSTRTFHLHSRLLISCSRYFEAALKKGRFVEGQTCKVELEDVDPSIFGLFVEWLYRDGWDECTPPVKLHETKIYLLVRTYLLGERLLSVDMQKAAADIIHSNINNHGNGYSDTAVCDLLEIVEMGIGTPDDPIADRILWLGVQRLQQLQGHDRFKCLLQQHRNLAMELCMRAGPRNQTAADKSRKRFKKEGMC